MEKRKARGDRKAAAAKAVATKAAVLAAPPVDTEPGPWAAWTVVRVADDKGPNAGRVGTVEWSHAVFTGVRFDEGVVSVTTDRLLRNG